MKRLDGILINNDLYPEAARRLHEAVVILLETAASAFSGESPAKYWRCSAEHAMEDFCDAIETLEENDCLEITPVEKDGRIIGTELKFIWGDLYAPSYVEGESEDTD